MFPMYTHNLHTSISNCVILFSD